MLLGGDFALRGIDPASMLIVRDRFAVLAPPRHALAASFCRCLGFALRCHILARRVSRNALGRAVYRSEGAELTTVSRNAH